MPDASGGFLGYTEWARFYYCGVHNRRKGVSVAEKAPIRVMIVDDHDMVRSGLMVFLDAFDDLELVGEAADGTEALHLCAETRPGVILMDLLMPEMDGIAATRAIRQTYPNVQIIALTSFSDQDLVQRALQAGAAGYVLKNAPIDELANAIRAAFRNSSPQGASR
jgi:NarL family two-component system response regulator LiaR